MSCCLRLFLKTKSLNKQIQKLYKKGVNKKAKKLLDYVMKCIGKDKKAINKYYKAKLTQSNSIKLINALSGTAQSTKVGNLGLAVAEDY